MTRSRLLGLIIILIAVVYSGCRPRPAAPLRLALSDLANVYRLDPVDFQDRYVGRRYTFTSRVSDIDPAARVVSRKIRDGCLPLFVAALADEQDSPTPSDAGVYEITAVLSGVDATPGDRGVSWTAVTLKFESATVRQAPLR